MKLTLNDFPVEALEDSPVTELDGRRLLVNRGELRENLLDDGRLQAIEIDLVHPGESCRIINILDILEPRIKAAGEGETFSGILGPAKLAGSGTTNVLKGVSVMTCGPLDGAEDAFLDMSGPCADLSQFSSLETVVVRLTPAEGLSRGEFARAAVEAGVRASVYLAETTRSETPEDSNDYELAFDSTETRPNGSLPRISYIYPLYSQGDARDMLLYGKNTRELLPTLIHPNEVLDGAVVWSGFCRPTKNTTYDHLNHGVIKTLYKEHGNSIRYVGTIVANHPGQFTEKTLYAAMMARVAGDVLGSDGVIITKDSGGQADTDLMQICEQCEARGIKTTILTMEFAGQGGSSAGALVDASPRADAIVSAGNCAEVVQFPAVEKVVGGRRLKDYDQDPGETLQAPYNKVPGAIAMLGANTVTALEF